MQADESTFGQKFLTNEKLQWLMDKKKNIEYAQCTHFRFIFHT